jgi:hypothetical protein
MTPKEPAPGMVLRHPGFAARRRVLDVPRRSLPPLEEIEREIAAIESRLGGLPDDDREAHRAIRPRLNALRMDRSQRRTDPAEPGQTEPVELQAFRLSDDCTVVMLPGEFFVELAREIERDAGIPHLLVCGYANMTAGYFPTTEAFPEGGYEAGRARFAEGMGPTLAREAATLVRSLYGAGVGTAVRTP